MVWIFRTWCITLFINQGLYSRYYTHVPVLLLYITPYYYMYHPFMSMYLCSLWCISTCVTIFIVIVMLEVALISWSKIILLSCLPNKVKFKGKFTSTVSRCMLFLMFIAFVWGLHRRLICVYMFVVKWMCSCSKSILLSLTLLFLSYLDWTTNCFKKSVLAKIKERNRNACTFIRVHAWLLENACTMSSFIYIILNHIVAMAVLFTRWRLLGKTFYCCC